MFEDITNYRHEHKYIEPKINLLGLKTRLNALMTVDPHASDREYYNIRSLYFDDYDNRSLTDNVDGVGERMKWRIRIYDHDSSHISLERKIRRADLISKQSCVIDRDIYAGIMDKSAKVAEDNPPLLNMFINEMKMSGLHPVIIVEYERIPYVCSRGNTRVTIDQNIRSSSEIGAFLENRELSCRPVLPAGSDLLEVKFDRYLPDHIAHAIEHGRMRRETFSKYYLARKFSYSAAGRYS